MTRREWSCGKSGCLCGWLCGCVGVGCVCGCHQPSKTHPHTHTTTPTHTFSPTHTPTTPTHTFSPLSSHHHHHQAFDSNTRFLVCVTVMFRNPADGFCADRAHGSSGSAKRRRERRLRAMLRHERQTVAMELAAALHQSRDGGRQTYYGLRAPRTASSGGRPGVLKEPEPPNMVDRVLRRTVDQLADAAPVVQVLDTPVPQMVEQLLEVLRRLDIEVPAQVIEVPKISQDSIREHRGADR